MSDTFESYVRLMVVLRQDDRAAPAEGSDIAKEESKMIPFCDKAGREVQPGDLLVYGVNVGRCAGLDFGLALENRGDKLKIIGVDWHPEWTSSSPVAKKTSFLQFGSRCLVLPKSCVPEVVLDTLMAAFLERTKQ
jgi:hypothetical protein